MSSLEDTPGVFISSSQKTLRVPRKLIGRLVRFVLARQGARAEEIDIAVVGSREMAALNRRYLGHRGTTDVISFDLSDDLTEWLKGQIVVCADVARAHAEMTGTSVQRELLLYVTHGLLHLLDYDDTSTSAALTMHTRQRKLLDEFLASR